jgi:hypothetical protein
MIGSRCLATFAPASAHAQLKVNEDLRKSDYSLRQHGTFLLYVGLFSPGRAKKTYKGEEICGLRKSWLSVAVRRNS